MINGHEVLALFSFLHSLDPMAFVVGFALVLTCAF